jgi:cardiolipin synthase
MARLVAANYCRRMFELPDIDTRTYLTAAAHIGVASAVTVHVLRRNLQVRSAVGWIGVVWLSPFLGSIVYFLLGINRVSRRAVRARRRAAAVAADLAAESDPEAETAAAHLFPLAQLIRRVTRAPLTRGNSVEPLVDGDAAYPAMLAAIEGARCSIALCTYIFRADAVGAPFIAALARAQNRGVAVRVLLDGMGSGYFFSRARRALERAGVPVAQFFHTFVPWRMPYLNMRLHKKLLIVDGTTGFVGGMNIGAENVHASNARARAIRDLHCRVEGPVVRQLFVSFADDWHFETGERLLEEKWCLRADAAGPVRARGIASGPDEDLMRLETIILGALAAARYRVRITTPYFLPEHSLLLALSLAALRGVKVEIVLPRRSNHRFMDWAAWAQHGFLVESGCEIHLTGPPFDHTKLMTVDGNWSLFGSANWDARSLRLNFEYNVAALDAPLAAKFDALVDAKIARARRLTLPMINGRRPLVKIRDGLARLFLPYL